MIRVYASLDRRGRCITFDEPDPVPWPPLELVRAFRDDEAKAAYILFADFGDQPPRRSKGWSSSQAVTLAAVRLPR